MIDSAIYTAREIERATGGALIGDDVTIEGITIDSREKCEKSSCFFAINGESYNGAEFVTEAISHGARLIVCQEPIRCPVSVIYVDNTVKALGLLGKHHKGKTRTIGITGSVGKTTTKDMTLSVLKQSYKACGTNKNFNNEIGVALTLLSIKNEEVCVIEMGMRQRGEIDWLSYITEPTASVITNCGSSHLERLGSRESIFLAKTEILNHTSGVAVLPNLDSFKTLNLDKSKAIYFGNKGDCYFERERYLNDGISFYINYFGSKSKRVFINSKFKHNLSNALCAYSVGKIFGMEDECIIEGIGKYRGTNLREEFIEINGVEIILDCYNASYESMKDSVSTLNTYSRQKNKKAIALLGDMLEIGEESPELHYEIGKLCKEYRIENLIAYGSFADCYLNGYCNGVKIDRFEDIYEALKPYLKEGYVILVKASRAEKFEFIIEKIREMENVQQ